MITMLHGADLLNSHWSYAFLHAVYLKNRLPHRALNVTPYEMLTSTQPDVFHLRIFGSFLTSKIPGDRRTKLATNIIHGTFLVFIGTDRNVIFRDETSNQVKKAWHVVFDKIYYNRTKQLTYAKQLYNFGNEDIHNTPAPPQVQDTTPIIPDITTLLPTTVVNQ